MRQIATLPEGDAARALSDYLRTLQIDTRLERQAEGWAVWVCDEDRVPQARQELAEFERNPSDPRYARAARQAQALRLQERRTEEEYQRRQSRMHKRMADPATRPAPWTFALVVVCGAVALLSRGGRSDSALVQDLSISSYQTLQDGGIRWPYLQQIARGQVWRVLTPIFLHFGPWHLLFNVLMLLSLGRPVENRRGAWRYLLLILVLAVPSNVAQYYLSRLSWQDGALVIQPSPAFGGMSGVLYGLFGYIWMKSIYEPELGLVMHPNTVVWLLGWFFLCMTGVVGPIANVAHAAGLIVGLVIGIAPHVWYSFRGR
jgi:GlpG protein